MSAPGDEVRSVPGRSRPSDEPTTGNGRQGRAPLRVLWIIKGLGPGGAERLLVSAAAAHDHDRFEFEAAYVLPHKGHLAPDLRSAGVTVHELGRVGDRPGAWVPRLRRLLVDGDYDVVHLHSPVAGGVARFLSRTLPRRRRPALISTHHSSWHSLAPPTWLLNCVTWPFDDVHLVVSEQVRESIRPRRLARDAEVLIHGVDLRALAEVRSGRSAARRSLGIDESTVAVVTIANYRAPKDYPNLLAAARVVADRTDRVQFLAVGQGPLEREIEQRHADLGLEDRFRLLGYQQDPTTTLAAGDIFVMASRTEGFPVAMMEALAVGLPVVATSVGGIPDAVRDGVEGRLVPPGRPDHLAEAILDVAEDDVERKRLAASALERGENYDVRHAIERLEQVYFDVGSRRG